MAQVEVIENNSKRGRVFWGGFLIGVIFSLIAVIVFWFLGVINFGSGKVAVDNQNKATSDFDNSFLSNDQLSDNSVSENVTNNESNNTTDNSTGNNTANETNNSTGGSSAAAGFYGSAVMATDVDDAANPVGETTTFSKDDQRFYVVLTLKSGIAKGAKIAVKWRKGSSLLSEFSTKSEAGQTRVYFFQTNPGVVDDYSAQLSVDGEKVDEVHFAVK